MFPAVPDRALLELGRTEGGPDTLDLLVRDQDTRRLLVLRAVLDAAQSADHSVCTPEEKDRVREDWAMLGEADREAGGAAADEQGTGTGPSTGPAERGWSGGRAPSPVSPSRALLFQPLTGPWARSVLRGLDAEGSGPPDEPRARRLRRDLAHLSAMAAVAAARAGLTFTTRLTARAGVLTLPSLGALHTATPGDVPVDVVAAGANRMTLRQADAPDVTIHLESGTGAWSGALAWTPAHALPGLMPSAPAMPLDDLDPYRAVTDGPRYGNLSGPVALDDAARKRWLQAWSGTAAALRSGGAQRLAEAVALLRCLVPLAMPPDRGSGQGSCSATRRDAFGALLSSTPSDPVTFAATVVHELQHAKLAALGRLLPLHRAGSEARYFAPWRSDPRPYDGLLQGTYSHLAMASFFQRRALITRRQERERAWAQHARYHAQVGAALPALVGSPDLTTPGRRFVDEMAAAYEHLGEYPAPRGHTARAEAYVKAARTLWTQRHDALLRAD
ncbi:HEXXH motif-containing putative peptide modification protein [Streptomyces sp. NPDC005925]|uniref:aKG-HExxH-type peptide beta-hydroxylase n=1 Tax=Streptomyces sp. NPDC005925 TaxID=3157172 RepID=UPI0033E9D7E0